MIKFEKTAPSDTPATSDVHGFAKLHGLDDKEAARIFLKLGPSPSVEDVRTEVKLHALKLNPSNAAFKS
jgi:hypothetical protein